MLKLQYEFKLAFDMPYALPKTDFTGVTDVLPYAVRVRKGRLTSVSPTTRGRGLGRYFFRGPF